MKRPRFVAAAALTASFAIAPLVAPTPPTASAAAVTRATKVFMVSDSVGLGARWAIPKAFPANWRVDVTGKAGIMTDQLMRWYVDPQLTPNAYDNAIVATGYNYPYWDPARFRRMVDDMVNLMVARGVRHVYWITIREVSPANYSGWGRLTPQYQNLFRAYPVTNSIIKQATARHPQLSIIDWAAVSDQLDLTADGIHLNGAGVTRYSTLVREIVTGGPRRVAAGTTTRLHLAGTASVPTDTTGVALQVSVDNPRTAGGLVVWPCSASRPLVNNLTWGVGEPVSGPLVAPLDESGDTCLWQSTDARLSVQLVGVFAPSAGYAYLRNSRTLSTLTGTSTNTVTIVPDTVTPTTVLAHISGAAGTAPINYSVFTCGTQPSAPTVTTFVRGSATTLALLRTGADGSVCVRSSGGGKVAITVVGTFDDSSAAAAARQVFDSRAPIRAALSTPVQVAGVGSLPAVGTLTGALVSTIAWFPSDPGALSAGQCPASSGSSRLTPLEPHHPRSAAAFAPIDAATGRFCIRSSVPSRVSINVVGTFGTGFTPVTARMLRNG